jgi:hypothetical protein
VGRGTKPPSVFYPQGFWRSLPELLPQVPPHIHAGQSHPQPGKGGKTTKQAGGPSAELGKGQGVGWRSGSSGRALAKQV